MLGCYGIVTRIANAIFHLPAFARFPVSHGTINCLSMIDGTTYLVMDSMIEFNDYYHFHMNHIIRQFDFNPVLIH